MRTLCGCRHLRYRDASLCLMLAGMTAYMLCGPGVCNHQVGAPQGLRGTCVAARVGRHWCGNRGWTALVWQQGRAALVLAAAASVGGSLSFDRC